MYMYNLTAKLTFMANYDYVHGDRLILNTSTDPWKLSKPVYYRRGGILEVRLQRQKLHCWPLRIFLRSERLCERWI